MDLSIEVTIDPANLRAEINEAAVRTYTESVVKSGAQNAAQMMRNGPQTGVHYPGLPNRSSAPGQPPAVQSGELIGSLDSRVLDAYTGQVFETAPHAQYLEYGSPGGKIAERPHMRPGLCKAIDETDVPDDLIKLGGR